MNQSLTISVRGLLIAGVAGVAVLAAYLLGSSGGPPTAQAQAPAMAATDGTPDSPLLTMTGRGTGSAVPDQLSFTLTASAKRENLQDALEVSSQAMQKAQKTLKEYGVADEDLATTGLRMNPEYDYPQSGPPVLTGYRVTQKARVSIDDLSAGGEAIAAVVRSGASTVKVDGIRLEVADADAVLAQARDDAVQEAQSKAEQYAAAAGVELGGVVSIQEVQRSSDGGDELRSSAEMDSSSDAAYEVPVAAGEQESGVTVEVIWSLAG